MKFELPPEVRIRVRKGELFTLLDVPCSYCGAKEREPCVTRSGRLSRNGRNVGVRVRAVQSITFQTHAPRRNLRNAFVDALITNQLAKRLEPPYWAPSWARKWCHSVGRYVVIHVEKSANVRLNGWEAPKP